MRPNKNLLVTEEDDPQKTRVGFATGTVILAVILGLLFYYIDYVEKEGFNPSDDGVVLAQSFRIINGEIPHKDFIAIRPVFSGILHSIHFFIPAPLEISARWFTMIQYFIYSFVWIYILLKILNIKIRNRFAFLAISLSIGLFSFLLNLNKYNLFPWTTVDAIFLSVFGFMFLFTTTRIQQNKSKKLLYTIAGLFFISLAAITRQSFVLIACFVFLAVTYKGFKSKKYLNTVFALILGSSPLWAYFIFLINHDALQLFLQQMTGRTELVETGFIQYLKSFIKAKLFILNLATICLFIFIFLKNKTWLYNKKTMILSEKQRRSAIAVVLFYNVAAIIFSFWHFINKSMDIWSVPFELFWILFVISILAYFTIPLLFRQKAIIVIGLLLAWSSSISLGDNTPIFTSGIIASQIFVLSAFLISRYNLRFAVSRLISKKVVLFSIIITMSFTVVSIYGQQQVNYRDKKSSELTACLCSVSEEFGTIKTNKNTLDYYADFINLYQNFPGMKNNFVMIPNNAIMYPIMNSKNPFPLDWMQPDEYRGSEKYLDKKIEETIDLKNIYLVVDIYNSKEMAFNLTPLNLKPYKYLAHFKNRFIEIPVKSKFFKIYKSI